jgi:hypothetical protein
VFFLGNSPLYFCVQTTYENGEGSAYKEKLAPHDLQDPVVGKVGSALWFIRISHITPARC